MGINGVPVQGVAPALLTSQTGGGVAPLLSAAFETNPMDGLCDQRVKATTQPVEICYDAVSLYFSIPHFIGKLSVHVYSICWEQ